MVATNANWTHDFVHTNGINLHYVTQGEGELLLMLHGFPEFWYSWRHQIPEFAKDYKVVAPDLRGYNDSDKPKNTVSYRMNELIEDVRGIIQGLGFDRCTLVGHDWGGAVAWCFAYAYPEMLDKLVIMNLPHPAKFGEALRSNPQQLLRSWYIFLFQLPFVPEWLLQWNDYGAIASAFQSLAVDKSTFTKEDLEAYKNAAAKPGALTAMLNYYRTIFTNNFLEQKWGILKVPTLLIWGEEDTALGKELTYGTEEYVKDLKVRYIPNCSHWVQQEQPQLVNRYIREFLIPPSLPANV
jgi:pimeloyl-ACP methyl ester carboxylesterase